MRIASFNTENLFSRARALNIRRTETIKKWLEKIGELQDLLNKDSYDKPTILICHIKMMKRPESSIITIHEKGVKTNSEVKLTSSILFFSYIHAG